jgi:glutamate-1-semialdehyde 2,1-aminomutase
MVVQSGTSLDEAYAQKFPRSRELYQRAQRSIVGGITHDGRRFGPFPVYVTRAQGSKKWDADGNEILDHWMGHGSLLLGHNHPAVLDSIQEQMTLGTHYGACHELEVQWAELITRLVPSAERVRFTLSGTEATMLAMRDARAFTGREKIIRFAGHFHGWHDYALVGYQPPFDVPTSAGIPRGVAETMLIARPNDLDGVRALMDQHEVAAVIIEAGGGSNASIPHAPGFLEQLRTLTRERGVVLIFDEVISGFRYAPGGAQQRYGVTPDMSTMAKIVAGGLPGGAVAGRADIMEIQAFTSDAQRNRFKRVLQQGTFNASPATAAGAVACLSIVAEGEANVYSDRMADAIRTGYNEAFKRRGVPGLCYGESSVFKVALGQPAVDAVHAGDAEAIMKTGRAGSVDLRRAMLVEGVDMMGNSGFTSIAHTDADVNRSIEAFERALQRLLAVGLAYAGRGSLLRGAPPRERPKHNCVAPG